MTKETFLSNPVAHYFGSGPPIQVPAEWFREAWDTNSVFREEIIYYYTDSVAKSGSVRFPVSVGELSGYLSAAQIIQLYEGLRDGADRCETEWRSEFQEVFPQCADRLPPINRARVCYYFAHSLIFGMKHKDFVYLRQVISDCQLWTIALNELKLPASAILANFECLVGAGDSDIFSVLQLAEAEGMVEIAALLREAGATE